MVEVTPTIEPTEKPTEKPTATPTEKPTATPKPTVQAIFLSQSSMTLGLDETATLIATVSPANISTILQWSSSDPTVAEVDSSGKVTAKKQGLTVIRVQSDNGIVSVCNVEVKQKTGTVSGEVTWKYNSYVGYKPDTGAIVYLISRSVRELNSAVALGLTTGLPEGVYATKVNGSGAYIFDSIPVGSYEMVIISKNTNDNPSKVTESSNGWSIVYSLFSETDQEMALLTAQVYRVYTKFSLVVNENQTTTYSHAFGITYS
ncbi:MAG: Ig-like domain-containing protein [Clostridia bacterium]|nr:Ig-like domain-containing protein [Clostridia bacterium]